MLTGAEIAEMLNRWMTGAMSQMQAEADKMFYSAQTGLGLAHTFYVPVVVQPPFLAPWAQTIVDQNAAAEEAANMAWNWEKGCDEPDNGNGPLSQKDPVQKYRKLEAAYAGVRLHQRGSAVPPNLLAAFFAAEAKILNFETEAVKAQFRQGYIDFIEKNYSTPYRKPAPPPPPPDIEVKLDQLPILSRIVTAGYRELAKRAHPDVGGKREDFEELRAAKVQLDALVEELKRLL